MPIAIRLVLSANDDESGRMCRPGLPAGLINMAVQRDLGAGPSNQARAQRFRVSTHIVTCCGCSNPRYIGATFRAVTVRERKQNSEERAIERERERGQSIIHT